MDGGRPAGCDVGQGFGSAEASPGELMEQERDHRRRRSATEQGPDSETGTVRWIASSTGRGPNLRPQRKEFPRSSVSAWEAAVTRGRQEVPPRAPIGQDAPDRQELPEADDYDADEGVEANARLTGMTAALLLVLLAVEGVTILRIGRLLTLHVLIGMVVVPPVLLKIGSTTWRFARYYLGSPEYRRKGPPPAILRLLGPFLVVLTLAVLGSGIALLLGPPSRAERTVDDSQGDLHPLDRRHGCPRPRTCGRYGTARTQGLLPADQASGPRGRARDSGHSSVRSVSGSCSQ